MAYKSNSILEAFIKANYTLEITDAGDEIVKGIRGGVILGSIKSCGRRRVEIPYVDAKGKKVVESVGFGRLKFFLKHGYMPPEIDHLDLNKQNDALSNLAPATASQNSINKKKRKGQFATPFKGVSIDKRYAKKPYIARLCRKFLGSFASAADAARAYDKAVRADYGIHGRYNFPAHAGERRAI